MFSKSELFDKWWSGVRDALNPTAARHWAWRGWVARGQATAPPDPGKLTAAALAAQLEDLRAQLAALQTQLTNHIGTSVAASR